MRPISFDLTSPDGKITSLIERGSHLRAQVEIEKIPSSFRGFALEPDYLSFNTKSLLCQLGIQGELRTLSLEPEKARATAIVDLIPLNPFGPLLLRHITPGLFIGKLFAADPERLVRSPSYVTRLIGRKGDDGDPLFSLGGSSPHFFEKEGRAIAKLPVQGEILYPPLVKEAIPFLLSALAFPHLRLRQALEVHQQSKARGPLIEGELLLLKTAPLHIRTTFARVATDLLPPGYRHTSASLLDPKTNASGNIFEFFGSSPLLLEEIPLEFFTLAPYQENLLFSDRTDLQNALNPDHIRAILKKAPPLATFVVKTSQLLSLKKEDWSDLHPILFAIESGAITSEGVLLCPTLPLSHKHHLLSPSLRGKIKRLYFLNSPLSSEADHFIADLKKTGCEVIAL